MPLLDHFHPPLTRRRQWRSFHATWAGSIADILTEQLPAPYYAEEMVQEGAVEIDVATHEEEASAAAPAAQAATATVSAPTWAPPAPAMVMPAVFLDNFEVLVFTDDGGPRLVAAIELISPKNKDRSSTRRAFAAKCASCLCQGIGLVIVDTVTNRNANLHNEVVQLLENGRQFLLPADTSLYAVAYRPATRKGDEQIDVWPAPLALGQNLPVLPLALSATLCWPLDLEAAYTAACARRHLA
jgi:hypothetical protein